MINSHDRNSTSKSFNNNQNSKGRVVVNRNINSNRTNNSNSNGSIKNVKSKHFGSDYISSLRSIDKRPDNKRYDSVSSPEQFDV